MNNSGKIFIVILNWNGWKDTLDCLDSLKSIDRPKTDAVGFIVVDNGSTDNSVHKIEEYIKVNGDLDVEIVKNKDNLGFAGGNNKGIERALEKNAEWILLLNNDTVVGKQFLDKLLECAKSDSGIGFVNPKILIGNGGANDDKIWFVGGKIDNWTMKGSHIGYGEKDAGQYDNADYIPSDYATGCCVLFPAALIKKIGYMPEEYFLYYEDAEWSLRAHKSGLKTVIVPAAKIWHKGAASSKEGSVNYIRYHVRNGLMFSMRNGNLFKVLISYSLSFPRFLWQILKAAIFPGKRLWAKATISGIIDAWEAKSGKMI